MTRIQLRPFYTPQERARVYDHVYTHTWWPDHVERVTKTAALLDSVARGTGALSVADLSCGDGAIIGHSGRVWEKIYFGDLVPRPKLDFTGPIEETIERLPYVDLFLCSETLEHVEDPDALLHAIRLKADTLILTTPAGESDSRNPEHYWGWTPEDIRIMLGDAGWTQGEVQLWTPVYSHPDTYTFQMWTCS